MLYSDTSSNVSHAGYREERPLLVTASMVIIIPCARQDITNPYATSTKMHTAGFHGVEEIEEITIIRLERSTGASHDV